MTDSRRGWQPLRAAATSALVRGALVLGLGVAVTGCNAARAIVASPGDYADYRRVRLGRTLDERVGAAWAYLRARPEGRYAERLRTYLELAEPTLYRVRSRSTAGLESYLASLPDGPRSEEALADLMRLRNANRREQLSERATRAALLQVEAEGRARRAAANLVDSWVRGLVDPATWAGSFAAAPADLLARFRLVGAEPGCTSSSTGRRCTKVIRRAFRVRGDDGAVERVIELDLVLDLDDDYRLVRAELSGEAVALRTREAAAGEAAPEGDATRSAAWPLLVRRISDGLFADARACSGGEDGAGALRLDCDEPAVVLTVAREASGRERIELQRASKR